MGTTARKHRASGPRKAGWQPLHGILLVWATCAVSALVIGLGTTGTLASWTTAVIANDTNAVSTGTAVVLRETGPDDAGVMATCSSDQNPSNSYSCTTIQKYGGTGTTAVLMPGDTKTYDITFENVGTADAGAFRLTPGTGAQGCSQIPATDPTVTDLCNGTDLTIAVGCTDGATYTGDTDEWADLKQTATAPDSMQTRTHSATLAPNAIWTCRFSVSLDSSAPVDAQGISLTQPLIWTLTKA